MTASLASDTEYVLMAAGWSGDALDYTLTIEEYVCWDDDGDNYDDIACGGDDCDDAEAAVNPGATEGPVGDATCSDGIDNDCDGLIDADEGANCVQGGSSLAFGPQSNARTLGHIGLVLIPLAFVLGWRRRLN